MRFGAHISSAAPFSETILRAQKAECESLQIFANPPQRWNPVAIAESEIECFIELNKAAKIAPIVIHSIYLINLASSNPFFYSASQKSLIDEMKKAERLGALGVNTHLGSSKEKNFVEVVDKVVLAIKNILTALPVKSYFIIENSAGAGNIIGDTFAEIGEIIEKVGSKRVRVLLDTAHLFASGYRIDQADGLEEALAEFDKLIGIDKLVGLHLNDSATAFNSKRDRHADIGEGYIGLRAFERIIYHSKLKDLFGIIETPTLKSLEILRRI